MSEDGGGDDLAIPRDAGGRYVAGSSGNPAGKPRGALNRATRIAAALLEGEAEALLRIEIELAKAGDRMLLKHCIDRLIGPQRGQPVVFAMPPVETAGDIAAAVGAVLRAASRGLITPAEAESLTRAAAAAAQAVAAGERIERARLAAEQEAVERRFVLRAAALLFYGVREIAEEAGEVDSHLRRLCGAVMRIGATVLDALAAIPDTPRLVAADRAFLAAHPPRLDREVLPLAAAMHQAWDELAEHLTSRRLDSLDRDIAEREAAGEVAAPRYRTGMFERLCGPAAAPA